MTQATERGASCRELGRCIWDISKYPEGDGLRGVCLEEPVNCPVYVMNVQDRKCELGQEEPIHK